MQQEGAHVARVHLAGVIRNGAGQIEPSDDGHSMLNDDLSRTSELAIAAALAGQIDDHRPRRHARDHFLGHQNWRLLSGNDRGSDYHVAFRYNLSQEFALALVKCLILRPRVPARIFGILSLDGKLDEASAEALHLLFRRRTQVVRRPQSKCRPLADASSSFPSRLRTDRKSTRLH